MRYYTLGGAILLYVLILAHGLFLHDWGLGLWVLSWLAFMGLFNLFLWLLVRTHDWWDRGRPRRQAEAGPASAGEAMRPVDVPARLRQQLAELDRIEAELDRGPSRPRRRK